MTKLNINYGLEEKFKNTLQELIQNADDAGATCMKILYVGKKVNPQQNDEKKYRKFLRVCICTEFRCKDGKTLIILI